MDTINEIPHMISGYIHAHHLCDWVLVDGMMATIETIGLYSQVFFPDAFQLKITRLKLLEFRKKLSDNLQNLDYLYYRNIGNRECKGTGRKGVKDINMASDVGRA